MDRELVRGRERISELTPRETDVLKLIAKGCTNQQIAEALYISPHTAKNHVSNIYRKLGIDDRTQVALIALQMGLAAIERVEPEEHDDA